MCTLVVSIRPDFRRVASTASIFRLFLHLGGEKKIRRCSILDAFNASFGKERRESLELIVPPPIFRENRSHFTDRENGVTPFSFESRLRYNTSADDGYKRQRVPPPIHPFVFHQLDTTSQWIFSCEIGQRENLSEKCILIEERDVVGRIFSGESTGIDSKFEYIYIYIGDSLKK